MFLGNAVQAQDKVAACSLIRIDQYYGLKEWDCRVPNTSFGMSNVYTDKEGQKRVDTISSQQNAMCDDQGVCSNSGNLEGIALAGSYHYSFGWYLGTDTQGDPASYKSGTGPGFDGKYFAAAEASKDTKSVKTPACVVCMPTASINCSTDDREIENEVLPKYLSTVMEQDIKSSGGNCQSIPLFYDKHIKLLKLNRKYFMQVDLRNKNKTSRASQCRCKTHHFLFPRFRHLSLKLKILT